MSVISEQEAARFDLLKSRATISNEAQAVSAAALQEAMLLNAGQDEIAELQKALQNHLNNIETYVNFKSELEDRVVGAERVPEQLAEVAGKLALHSYNLQVPATPDQKSPYGQMAQVIQRRRNQRASRNTTESMASKMDRMRKAR